ncbi:hypothetical protein UA31_08870 [Photobacterium angustum]|uniref:Uncharacterized protein n=1 Tax=Photobacterium angustum TaxID=661 RepID=A0A855S7Q0_PHOAN|nr:hypothetical protein UB36_08865 [Photobacterium damselae subsp. damselae]KJG16614.1 hypothetical protein UA33_13835 [Photobacterium angustum]KJG22741.1 hypothetical protein UA39_13255 [Photobacterium angustum]KJG29724.1 hypothetical protein UA36_14645 [Photobacterium angustum]KJG41174.1 hypothetical protein UA35_10615 [Photobacterium angustum]
MLIYTYHIYAGMALVDNEEKTTPALLALLLQVPIISSPVLFYKVSTGFAASAYFESQRLTGYWNIGSEYQVHLLPSFNFGIGINIFALILVILLLKARKGFKSTQGQAKELRAEPIA